MDFLDAAMDLPLSGKSLMFRFLQTARVAVWVLLGSGGPAVAEPMALKWEDSAIERPGTMPTSFSPVLKRVLASVVTIEVVRENSNEEPERLNLGRDEKNDASRQPGFEPVGTGVILTEDGWVVTNAHALKSAAKCVVRLGGVETPLEAEIVGRDGNWDVALLKVRPEQPLKAAVLTAAVVETGDVALAVGNQYGPGQTVTKGIVSALGKTGGLPGAVSPVNFIQTDVPLDPENSGGPLLDVKGRVIGINARISIQSESGSGSGYAVPITSVAGICQGIQMNKTGGGGLFGLNLSVLVPERRRQLGIPDELDGLLITEIEMDLPANKAGLMPGDLVVDLGGERITDLQMFRLRLSSTVPGKSVKMKVFRNGKFLYFEPVAIARPAAPASK